MDFIALMIAFFINDVAMALVYASAAAWSSTTEVTRTYVTVAFLQLLVLLGELRPIARNTRAGILPK